MYVKVFGKILDSSIWLAPDPHRIAWITLLAAMNQDGFAAFASHRNLAARARISDEDAAAAVASFAAPDLDSADPENDGRRIERVPGGYLVLNADKYRKIVSIEHKREQDRERATRYRERQRHAKSQGRHAKSRQAEAEAEAEANAKAEREKDTSARPSVAPTPIDPPLDLIPPDAPPPDTFAWLAEFKAIYPLRAGQQPWVRAKKAANARIVEGHTPTEFIEGAKRYAAFVRATGKERTEFVQQAATFLGPSKPFLEDWEAPATKAEIRFNANAQVARDWANQETQ